MRLGLPARAPDILLLLTLGLATIQRPVAGAQPQAAQPERPSDETLRGIEERGRQIASAIAAVAKGRDLVARQGEGITPPDKVVAIEDRGMWKVLFLRDVSGQAPGMPRQGTLIVAETDYSPISEDVGPLRASFPPRPAPATTVSYARALGAAEEAAAGRGETPPFEAAVIREKNGAFTVYLQSRPPGRSVVSFGRDLVAHVAANGRQLVSIEPLHSSSTDIPLEGRSGGQPTLHVHPAEDLPTPTDVAQVCGHGSIAPHLVMTPHFIFRIGDRGALSYLGPNQPAGTERSGASAPPAASGPPPAVPGTPSPAATPGAAAPGRLP
jgi:hypothetical protein